MRRPRTRATRGPTRQTRRRAAVALLRVSGGLCTPAWPGCPSSPGHHRRGSASAGAKSSLLCMRALRSVGLRKAQHGDLIQHTASLSDNLTACCFESAFTFQTCRQEAPAAGEGAFRDTAVADHDDIRGVRMGAGERSYLVRDRRIDVLRNVHGGVQARRYLAACTPQPSMAPFRWKDREHHMSTDCKEGCCLCCDYKVYVARLTAAVTANTVHYS